MSKEKASIGIPKDLHTLIRGMSDYHRSQIQHYIRDLVLADARKIGLGQRPKSEPTKAA